MKSTKVIGGKRFTKVSCSTSKSSAKARAKAIRKTGSTARVIGNCVYKGPKSKSKKR